MENLQDFRAPSRRDNFVDLWSDESDYSETEESALDMKTLIQPVPDHGNVEPEEKLLVEMLDDEIQTILARYMITMEKIAKIDIEPERTVVYLRETHWIKLNISDENARGLMQHPTIRDQQELMDDTLPDVIFEGDGIPAFIRVPNTWTGAHVMPLIETMIFTPGVQVNDDDDVEQFITLHMIYLENLEDYPVCVQCDKEDHYELA